MPDLAESGIFGEASPPVPEGAGARSRASDRMAFLDANGWGDIVPAPLAGDASFRRYYRLRRNGRNAVLMDAPPPLEDVSPYIAVSGLLRDLGFSAPAIFAEDRLRGFLLIEDFGDDTYTRLLDRGTDEVSLYALAVDTLVELHRAVEVRGTLDLSVPPYDTSRLLAEAVLLTDWYAPAVLGSRLSEDAREEYLAIWQAVLPQAALPGGTLVLRDYHVDNLMLLADRPGAQGCGLLDFQDAVYGPSGYDLISLLEDARRDLGADLRWAMTERYLSAFPDIDRTAFLRSAAILATQRNCKILGIFTRLWKRDGKAGYLVHVPRLWRLLERELAHHDLAPVARWFNRHLPRAARRTPAP
jgi:aminoglycoside/choline kinase family phosphotransferase